MRTVSRDGKLIISAPDGATTGFAAFEDKHDTTIDVTLQVVEGYDVTLKDVAHAIVYDCFASDGNGLSLNAKKLNCSLSTLKKDYYFTVPHLNGNLNSYIAVMASQLKL